MRCKALDYQPPGIGEKIAYATTKTVLLMGSIALRAVENLIPRDRSETYWQYPVEESALEKQYS